MSTEPDWGVIAEQRAEAERDRFFNPSGCSDPPGESCSDAGCPVHGGSDDLDRDDDEPY